ncbi:hypothetical protein F5884DRAFT_860574 [Xylogone sp. PMI_703]|nr:hypothetical protein F5884DRAFT_860574 [Xylogone sp. PMI_703]
MDSPRPTTRATLLRTTARSFCAALTTNPPASPKYLLQTYFVPELDQTSGPQITEHGPKWATSRLPFLSRPFTGGAQCEEYFSLLSSTLKMELHPESFPNSSEEFIVDSEAEAGGEGQSEGGKGVVVVVGNGKFESIKTGKSWHEEFHLST